VQSLKLTWDALSQLFRRGAENLYPDKPEADLKIVGAILHNLDMAVPTTAVPTTAVPTTAVPVAIGSVKYWSGQSVYQIIELPDKSLLPLMLYCIC
jgi:hypothetical protein